MSSSALKLLAASGAKGSATYVDDVFSTFLYEGGLASPKVIPSGIDLSGEGGLVWTKSRTTAVSHQLTDTVSGYRLSSDSSSAGEASQGNVIFNSDGHSYSGYSSYFNGGSTEYASWTFRKAPGFFDVVTYTGNGVTGRTVAHNLGSIPGMIIIKRTDAARSWIVYHRSTGNGYILKLDQSAGKESSALFNNTTPTDALFTLNNDLDVNASGGTFVAYLFAHDAQEFGTDEDESIIKCGSYTGNGNADGPTIDLGFEPQWLLLKSAGGSDTWQIVDVMRNWSSNPGGTAASQAVLSPQTSAAESNISGTYKPTSTGFKITQVGGIQNDNGVQYIYMAIRRPHKPASEFAATDLFNGVLTSSDSSTTTGFPVDIGFPVDFSWVKYTTLGYVGALSLNRLTGLTADPQPGKGMLDFTATGAEANTSETFAGDSMTGYRIYGHNYPRICYGFRRAPKFFDVVAYTGSAGAQDHGLGVIPELMIIRDRNPGASPRGYWNVYHKDLGTTHGVFLNSTQASTLVTSGTGLWYNTAPTDSFFYTGYTLAGYQTGSAGQPYIAYLFASVDGTSKVGSYTGTGNDLNVDCGFSAGARFILIKRTDSTGDWYYWDSVRGIVAGNDPYLLLNTTAAEVTNTDYIDPLASGFTVTSSAPAALNNNGGTYIFYAIA